MTADELQQRTFQFALDALAICDAFPGTASGQALSRQLVRSATAVGANYRSARRARSHREFTARLGIVKEEADEAEYWLAIAVAAKFALNRSKVEALHGEARELRAIFVSAHATARRRLRAEAAQRRSRTNILKSSNP